MTKKINYTVTVSGSNTHVVSNHYNLKRAAESYLRASNKYQGRVDLWDDQNQKLDAERDCFGQIIVHFADGTVTV